MNPVFHSVSCPNLGDYSNPQAAIAQPVAILPDNQTVPVDMNLIPQAAEAACAQLAALPQPGQQTIIDQPLPHFLPPLGQGGLVRENAVMDLNQLKGGDVKNEAIH